MNNENIQEKTLVLNPAGFLLKMLFSIGFMVFFMKQGASDNVGFFMNLMMGGFVFVGCYFIASLFGFALRATGNYIVSAIVFLIIFVVLAGVLSYIGSFGKFWNTIISLAAIGGLIWLPVRDIKKQYFTLKILSEIISAEQKRFLSVENSRFEAFSGEILIGYAA